MPSFSFVVVREHLFQPCSLSGGNRWLGGCGIMSNQKAFTATVTGDCAHDFQPFLGFFALSALDGYRVDSHHI
jgi:hypothetical protein